MPGEQVKQGELDLVTGGAWGLRLHAVLSTPHFWYLTQTGWILQVNFDSNEHSFSLPLIL